MSQLMGHSGIQITADIYTTLFEEVERDAAEAAAAIVPRRSSSKPPKAPAEPDVRTTCAPED